MAYRHLHSAESFAEYACSNTFPIFFLQHNTNTHIVYLSDHCFPPDHIQIQMQTICNMMNRMEENKTDKTSGRGIGRLLQYAIQVLIMFIYFDSIFGLLFGNKQFGLIDFMQMYQAQSLHFCCSILS